MDYKQAWKELQKWLDKGIDYLKENEDRKYKGQCVGYQTVKQQMETLERVYED